MRSLIKSIRETLLIFRVEALSLLRDRHTVIYTIIMPIFLYPIMFWTMNQVGALEKGFESREKARISIEGEGIFPEGVEFLRGSPDFEAVKVSYDEESLLDGEIEAALEIFEEDRSVEPPCFRMRIYYDGASDRSRRTADSIIDRLDLYRDIYLEEFSDQRSLSGEMFLLPAVDRVNLAESREIGKFILGRLFPMMIVIMAAMGTLYPAIEVVVGEREHETLESTLVLPTRRLHIMAAKYLAVAAGGVSAVFLNLFSMSLVVGSTIFSAKKFQEIDFSFPLESIPLIFLAATLLSLFFGAALILLASFTRNFREGQGFVTPFFIISFQPALIASFPGFELTPLTALIPIANVSLLFRDALNGNYSLLNISLVFLSLIICTILALWPAGRLFQREDFLWKGFKGAFKDFMRYFFKDAGNGGSHAGSIN